MARHHKGMAIFFSFVFLCTALMVVAAYKISEQPFFCGVCHNMKVYVESWKASKHKNVACIECHYKPGFMNHLKGKWKDGQLSLVYFITGKGPTKPHAEIDDASCLQKGCHRKEDLRSDIVFKNVVFNHFKHLDQLKRQKQLRCTTCHSQMVQGAHIIVTDVECFICHFYKTKDQKEYVTGCTSCHFEAKGDIQIGTSFDFNHKLYMARSIKCDVCHRNVVSGDGHIQENSCLKCHNRREILEAKYTPEFLHRNHVTDHKVECFECHSAIKHKIVPLRYTGQEGGVCSECHKPELHTDKINMYTGKSAKFAADHPNRMAVINMDCDVCHGPGIAKTSLEKRCRDCHNNITDGMIGRWKKVLQEKTQELRTELTETRQASSARSLSKEQRAVLDGASYNLEFLLKGDGIHNIVYAVEFVEASKNRLRALRAQFKATPFKPAPFKLSCTYMCHGDILQKKIPFGKVSFLHEIHAEGDDSCLKCHSPYTNHGKITLKGCSECHHGEGTGAVTCGDCHRVQEKLTRAKDSIHLKVACAECHTGIKTGKKEGLAAIQASCKRCHKTDKTGSLDNWLSQAKDAISRFDAARTGLEKQILSIEKKTGRHNVPIRKAYDTISEDIKLIAEGRFVHNPAYTAEVITRTAANIDVLKGMIKEIEEGNTIILQGTPKK